MKSSTSQTIIVSVACSAALISYVMAGAGLRSGPGFGSDNNPGVLGKTAKGSPGGLFNSLNNPGTLGSQFGRSNAPDAAASGAAHSGATTPVAVFNRDPNIIGAENRNAAVAAADAHRGQPHGQRPSPFPGVSPIPSATPGGTHSSPSPIPSATPGGDHPSPSPEPTETPGDHGVSPIPSATPGGTHSGVSPIPSATPGGDHPSPSPEPTETPGDHGVSPIPSATPGGDHPSPSPEPTETPGDHGVSPIPSATPGGTHSAPSPIPSATPGGSHHGGA
jgi:hypothetical protein